VEGAGDGGDVDLELGREVTVVGQAIAGLELAARDARRDRIRDAPIDRRLGNRLSESRIEMKFPVLPFNLALISQVVWPDILNHASSRVL
jgi:hypothetical protein